MSAQAPARGIVRAVCTSRGGIPKFPLPACEVDANGLAGDGHRSSRHGGPDRAVCLFSVEDYASLAEDGVQARSPGAFGENLLTEGLDYAVLAAGDRLAAGDECVLEITAVRQPCDTLRSIDARFPALLLGRSGFVCRVLRPGTVRPGDAIVRRTRQPA